MVKFLSTDIATNESKFINYYLVNMTVYPSNIATESAMDGYYHISYDKPANQFSNNYNVVYNNNPKNGNPNYITTDFYFYKLYHDNIMNVTDDNGMKDIEGEFIVKTVNTVDGSPLYLCFFLQKVTSKGTDDIRGPKTGTFSRLFNTLISDGNGNVNYKGSSNAKSLTISPSADGIPGQDDSGCIIYADGNAIVVVYLNPVTFTNTEFASFFSSLSSNAVPPFSKYPPNGKPEILSSQSVLSQTGGADEGGGAPSDKTKGNTVTSGTSDLSSANGQIYIDCNPTGESIDEIPVYSIPIKSDLVNDIQVSSFQQLCNNYVGFLILIVVAYIGVLKMYYMIVIQNGFESKDAAMSKYAAITYLIIVGALVFSVEHNMYYGFLLFFLAFLTNIIVSNEEVKLSTTESLKNILNEKINMIDFFRFFGDILTNHLLKVKVFSLIIFMWIILIVILSILYFAFGKITMSDYMKYALWIGLAAVPVLAGIIVKPGS